MRTEGSGDALLWEGQGGGLHVLQPVVRGRRVQEARRAVEPAQDDLLRGHPALHLHVDAAQKALQRDRGPRIEPQLVEPVQPLHDTARLLRPENRRAGQEVQAAVARHVKRRWDAGRHGLPEDRRRGRRTVTTYHLEAQSTRDEVPERVARLACLAPSHRRGNKKKMQRKTVPSRLVFAPTQGRVPRRARPRSSR